MAGNVAKDGCTKDFAGQISARFAELQTACVSLHEAVLGDIVQKMKILRVENDQLRKGAEAAEAAHVAPNAVTNPSDESDLSEVESPPPSPLRNPGKPDGFLQYPAPQRSARRHLTPPRGQSAAARSAGSSMRSSCVSSQRTSFDCPVIPVIDSAGRSVKNGSARPSTASSLMGSSARGRNDRIQKAPPLPPSVVPRSYELLSSWERRENLAQQPDMSPKSIAKSLALNYTLTDKVECHFPLWERRLERFVASPHSLWRLLWNGLSVGFIGYDAFATPLEVVNFPQPMFMFWMTWISRIFWSCDVPLTFLCGIVDKGGDTVRRPKAIAWAYISSWFFLDLAIVGFDWGALIFSGHKSASQMAKQVRLLRMLRMLRMLRITRMMKFLEQAFENLQSERLNIAGNIGKCLCCILWPIHMIACIWFGISSGIDDGWAQNTVHLSLDGSWGQFVVALHWSLTQFYGASEIHPWNTKERLVAILSLLFGCVANTWFVSSLTSSMTRLHLLSGREAALFATLRKYLVAQGISVRLSQRLKLNARHAFSKQQESVTEDRVELLTLVSEPLRRELHFETFSPMLNVHPLFAYIAVEHPSSVRHICHIAVGMMDVHRGDLLFAAGEVPLKPQMLFVCTGKLMYAFETKSSRDSVNSTIVEATHTLVYSDWACEPSLWTNWTYQGSLAAKDDCRLMVLDGDNFQEVAGNTRTGDLSISLYAAAYVTKMNSEDTHLCTDLDLHIDAASLVNNLFGPSDRPSRRESGVSCLTRASGFSLPFQFGRIDTGHSYTDRHSNNSRKSRCSNYSTSDTDSTIGRPFCNFSDHLNTK